MCVISISDTKRPTDNHVAKMFDANDAGAGIAWREDGFVRWEKGLDLKQIQDLVRSVPMPFIAHFRIPSCGGRTPDLTHPFPINKAVSLDLSGKTKDWVLFHNGHWGAWKNTALEAAIKKGQFKLPIGKWSDSRAMAWLANVYGQGILDLIDEKVAVLGPDEGQLEVWQGTGGWHKVDDIYVSNKAWEFRSVNRTYQGGYQGTGGHFNLGKDTVKDVTGAYDDADDYFCRAPYSLAGNEADRALKDKSIIETKEDSGGSPAEKTFPPRTETEESGKDKSEGVQKGEAGISALDRTETKCGASSHTALMLLPGGRSKVMTSEEEQEALKWAKSINPKAIGTWRVQQMRMMRRGVL